MRTLSLAGREYAVISRATAALDALTSAEREVAFLAAAGESNSSIARRRRTSARTVANQLASIYRKLSLNSRAELATYLSR